MKTANECLVIIERDYKEIKSPLVLKLHAEYINMKANGNGDNIVTKESMKTIIKKYL